MTDPAMYIPYARSTHGEEEIAAVVAVLRGSTQMGRAVAAFERAIADLSGKRHGVMVNSDTSALMLALDLADLPPGAEVVTPALSFATNVAALVRAGLTPVFVDVEADTLCVDCDAVERAIGPETRALLISNLAGNLPDWPRLADIARRHGLTLIENSCDTLGSTWAGRPCAIHADFTFYSFYGSHAVNCAGNGGMLCLDDDQGAERARLLRSWGRRTALLADSESIEGRFEARLDGIPYDAKFVFDAIGHNIEPSEAGAAFGLAQLGRLEGFLARRRDIFARHQAFFARWPTLFERPRQRPEAVTGWLAYPFLIRDEAPFTRRDLQIHLERAHIQTRAILAGNILRQPAFAGIRRRGEADDFPMTDRVMRAGMMIGAHQGLTDAMVERMHAVIEAFAAGHA